MVQPGGGERRGSVRTSERKIRSKAEFKWISPRGKKFLTLFISLNRFHGYRSAYTSRNFLLPFPLTPSKNDFFPSLSLSFSALSFRTSARSKSNCYLPLFDLFSNRIHLTDPKVSDIRNLPQKKNSS